MFCMFSSIILFQHNKMMFMFISSGKWVANLGLGCCLLWTISEPKQSLWALIKYSKDGTRQRDGKRKNLFKMLERNWLNAGGTLAWYSQLNTNTQHNFILLYLFLLENYLVTKGTISFFKVCTSNYSTWLFLWINEIPGHFFITKWSAAKQTFVYQVLMSINRLLSYTFITLQRVGRKQMFPVTT